jgi:DNA-binding PadR family transcriptional regulator
VAYIADRCNASAHRCVTVSGVLEMALLGLLTEKEMHGYELKKRLSDVFGLSAAVSFGSLYPALARLKAAGAIEILAPDGAYEGVPPEEAVEGFPLEKDTVSGVARASHEQGAKASHDARAKAGQGVPAARAGHDARTRRSIRRRKVYCITPHGAEMFRELLTSRQGASEDDRSFNLRLAFARYLPPEERLGLLEQRRLVLGERLAQLAARARARRDDRYMRILAERQQEELTHDVSWLERLIQEERMVNQAGLGSPSGPGLAARGSQEAPQLPQAQLPQAQSAQAQPAQAQLVPQGTPEARRPVPLASASQLKRPRELRETVPQGSLQGRRAGGSN